MADQSSEGLVSRGGEVADAVGVRLDARFDDLQELAGSRRPTVDMEKPVESSRPGREIGKSFGGDKSPGVQGTQLKAVRARSHSGVAGPAKSQSKNPVSLPWCQAALYVAASLWAMIRPGDQVPPPRQALGSPGQAPGPPRQMAPG